jgi:hypothetical protein
MAGGGAGHAPGPRRTTTHGAATEPMRVAMIEVLAEDRPKTQLACDHHSVQACADGTGRR